MSQIIGKSDKKQTKLNVDFLLNPQFWSIVSVFILITLHQYADQSRFHLFWLIDLPWGITRHTIDRILYLVPVVLSSFIFGMRGGLIAVAAALVAMLPRALFISETPLSALVETFAITAVGTVAPLWAKYHKRQEVRLQETLAQLQASEKRYRQLFESAHDAIWVENLDGKISAANEAAANLFGYELDALFGMDNQQLLSYEDFMLSRLRQKSLLSGQSRQTPYLEEIIRKDGSIAYVMLTANLVSNDGRPDGIQFIGRDITKEIRMQENQEFYLQQITKAHEDERQRISRDLHDSTAQLLIATLRSLEKFCEEDTELSSTRKEKLWGFHHHIKDILQEIRQLSRDLRPSIIDNLGLMPSVDWLVEQIKTEHNITAELQVIGVERRFSPEVEVTLFRIVQEALRNIAKHSAATNAHVIIDFMDAETKVTISDNGRGFDMPASLGELSRLGKLGVDGMQTRAHLVGGTFSIKSKPGSGTTIIVVIPASD